MAGTVSLSGVADPGGRWFEYFSDAFAQVDLAPQGFYQISALPGIVPVGAGALVFPFGANFDDFATVSYDAAGLSGAGLETAAITGLSTRFAALIADDDSILNLPYTEATTAVSGTVSFLNGALAAIDASADIVFTYDFTSFGAGPLDYLGTLSFGGNNFALDVDTSYASGFGAPLRYVWDFTGSVAVVPLPAAAWLLGSALLGLAGLGRRRAGAVA